MTRSLLERLDDSVRWTGIPALTQQPPRRRPLRWPATIALALAFGGVAFAAAHGMRGPAAALGYGVEMLGFAAGNFVQLLGPVKPFGSGVREVADEWDRAVRARAYLVTFAAFALVTILALGGLLVVIALDWPRPALAQGVAQTLFLLFTIIAALPTAQASWAVRWQRDDDHAG